MLTNTKWWHLIILVLCVITIHHNFPYNTMCLLDRSCSHIAQVNLTEGVGSIAKFKDRRTDEILTGRAEVRRCSRPVNHWLFRVDCQTVILPFILSFYVALHTVIKPVVLIQPAIAGQILSTVSTQGVIDDIGML